MSDGLHAGMFGDRPDWLAALLDVEAALATAKAAVGRIPAAMAERIVAHCRPALFDVAELSRRAAANATPIVPLVADLRAMLPDDVAAAVHTPATSQDVIDTALMLVASRRIDAFATDLDVAEAALTGLVAAHRDTPQAGRTLLARGMPTTFGRLATTWLAGVADARTVLDRARTTLAVQLGGAVGALDDPQLVTAFAEELRLAVPASCWHTNRVRVAELASALGMVTGALGKIAGDVVLLSQPEVGELAEGSPGGSSAMPDKRNSARSVQILACAHRAPALVGTVFAGLPQELQRAAGRWQAEWDTVGDLLALTTAAVRHARVLLDELKVDTERMRDNLR
ncbi:MAG TPA: lyase family protein [Pseudonocardiaceae bacterium]|jgi:3-carboxy-cis,cis-muconate cycloisomerase|nr:lyase family protein [Pseudonocardiaceae bacterium]